MTELAPGTIVGADFRIVRPLRQGGMGSVHLAEQLSTGAPAAVKVMHPQFVVDDRMRARFTLEAQVGSRIRSDHVVRVIAAGVERERPWLAMELVEGKDLSQLLAERGALPLDEVRELMAQLTHALGAAHDRGIVHRDLKPENLLLAPPRSAGLPFTLKVLDFGIAKILAESRTTSTAAIGTPLWMAPEQSMGADVSPSTDVWALGLMAYRLLTGSYFWRNAYDDAPSPEALMREIVLAPIEPASKRAARRRRERLLPSGFDAWFARCVARDPMDRYRNARRAGLEFEALFGGRRAMEVVDVPPDDPTKWVDAMTERAKTEMARTEMAVGGCDRTVRASRPLFAVTVEGSSVAEAPPAPVTTDVSFVAPRDRRRTIVTVVAAAFVSFLALVDLAAHRDTPKPPVDVAAITAPIERDRDEQLEKERRARASLEKRLAFAQKEITALHADLDDARTAADENEARAKSAEIRLQSAIASMKAKDPPCECPEGMFCPCE